MLILLKPYFLLHSGCNVLLSRSLLENITSDLPYSKCLYIIHDIVREYKAQNVSYITLKLHARVAQPGQRR